MKFLKQPAYIRYVIGKLSKFVKTSMHTSSDSFYREFYENQNGFETSIRTTFFIIFFINFFYFQYITYTDQISLPGCV